MKTSMTAGLAGDHFDGAGRARRGCHARRLGRACSEHAPGRGERHVPDGEHLRIEDGHLLAARRDHAATDGGAFPRRLLAAGSKEGAIFPAAPLLLQMGWNVVERRVCRALARSSRSLLVEDGSARCAVSRPTRRRATRRRGRSSRMASPPAATSALTSAVIPGRGPRPAVRRQRADPESGRGLQLLWHHGRERRDRRAASRQRGDDLVRQSRPIARRSRSASRR